MTSLGGSSSSTTEYTVRVPKNTTKKYNIMAFNSGDRVNCSSWTQARMERDMSARRIYGEEETPESGAGSEFGKKQREEARRKKFGIVTREFKVEDQPWILKVNGKAGKRLENRLLFFKITKKATGKGKSKKRKQKSNDKEALEDSDDGDYEGLEVDYMSEESRSAAASKLEQGKRQIQTAGTDSPAAKRLKMEPSSQSPVPSGKSTPQPPSGKSTPSSSDVQLTEEAVRRYLIRKPMTTKDLLKKFQTKRTGLSSEQTVNVLAQILKRLNPERKMVNDKMHFYLTE
ncbi:general transcription factor IIF subunit 1 [Poecilia reticulata]|uniref:general transcription factor IIF subunit 1 n=1 Tax=Poecilia reticulata TaxID=8081 RepID=UPI0007E9D4D1|nr:PREDICTED: general transcription factor IIF subunit 1 [Poecilia reticulata]